jgi:MYB-related transcription factor LHY
MVEHKVRKGERYWTDEEHKRFLDAVRLHGKNWTEITKHVGTRSRQSVYSHAQKFRKRVEKEPNLEGADCAQILSRLMLPGKGLSRGSGPQQQQQMFSRTNACGIEEIRPCGVADQE